MIGHIETACFIILRIETIFCLIEKQNGSVQHLT